jgi:hypothetical protein
MTMTMNGYHHHQPLHQHRKVNWGLEMRRVSSPRYVHFFFLSYSTNYIYIYVPRYLNNDEPDDASHDQKSLSKFLFSFRFIPFHFY